MIPLSKMLDPERDYPELAPELLLVDAVGIGEQHPHRRFEYALALRAIAEHRKGYAKPPEDYRILDVGGGGSTFAEICRMQLQHPCSSVDPSGGDIPFPIETMEFASAADAITSLSVIEHVPDPLPFLQACHRALAPGGLFFLTMDCWDGAGPDTAMFHWMRERIYNPGSWQQLWSSCQERGFRSFGATDWTYHGNQLFNAYTFASLALTKEA
jgi:SAM-dependent methyltransferase